MLSPVTAANAGDMSAPADLFAEAYTAVMTGCRGRRSASWKQTGPRVKLAG